MNVPRTYDWNGKTDLPMSRPDVDDVEVARLVRMLCRTDLNHEYVCTLARDRIMALVKENAQLRERSRRQIPDAAICLYRDGDQWCCVSGDFWDLQTSPAGFGNTFQEALDDFKATLRGPSHE